MFTGIVRSLGTVGDVTPEADGALQLTIDVAWPEKVNDGDSVAVNGACLTVLGNSTTTISFHLMPETLRKTNLGAAQQGSKVNLERPLTMAARLDGHFVQGHVDGLATVTKIVSEGQDKIFTFQVARELAAYLIPKGSVALDGVSLTVIDCTATTFRISMMPYTLEHTTFHRVTAGYQANFEADMIGKYVAALTQKYVARHDA